VASRAEPFQTGLPGYRSSAVQSYARSTAAARAANASKNTPHGGGRSDCQSVAGTGVLATVQDGNTAEGRADARLPSRPRTVVTRHLHRVRDHTKVDISAGVFLPKPRYAAASIDRQPCSRSDPVTDRSVSAGCRHPTLLEWLTYPPRRRLGLLAAVEDYLAVPDASSGYPCLCRARRPGV
jgi:hypothetical protein